MGNGRCNKAKNLTRATERLIVNTEIKLPTSKTTSFVIRPCKNKEIVAESGFVREAAPFLRLCVLGSSQLQQKASTLTAVLEGLSGLGIINLNSKNNTV